jgi:hypothetical protein
VKSSRKDENMGDASSEDENFTLKGFNVESYVKE